MEYFGAQNLKSIEMEYLEAGRKDAVKGINRAEQIMNDIITKTSTIVDVELATLMAALFISFYEKGQQEVVHEQVCVDCLRGE